MNKQCSNCKHWGAFNKYRIAGYCLRHAPIVIDSGHTEWPKTWDTERCGDFETLIPTKSLVSPKQKCPFK